MLDEEDDDDPFLPAGYGSRMVNAACMLRYPFASYLRKGTVGMAER
jgi:hypothetical protein